MSTLLVCGLNREAAIAAGPGIVAVAGGGDRLALEGRLAALDASAVGLVISFGLAGALTPALAVGSVLLPREIHGGDGRHATDAPTRSAWRARLLARGVEIAEDTIAGVDRPVLTAAGKAALRAATGAAAVDMESHVAAAWAARHRLPYAVLRVISDPAGSDLPPIAGRAMRPDGSVDVVGVMGALARDPGQLPALLRTARDAGRAFRTLGRVRGLLGPRLGLLGPRLGFDL